jgi:integral membrane protein
MNNPISILRWTGLIEGVSFILLVGIAMPLKYVWGQPRAVSMVGMLHGLLFVLFCAALARAMWVGGWPLSRGALVFVAALLPFGPFVIDRRVKQYESEFRERLRR